MTGARTGGTVGEALIDALEAEGVRHVFGIPGVHTIELYRGLGAASIRHVLPRHEQTAGFMADGYARMSGEPGVCFVITGPGLTNALTAMAQARGDCVPMLVISGVNPVGRGGRGLGLLHELPDQRGLVEKVALWSRTVHGADALHETLAQAFARLRSERPGPVHVEIPVDVMRQAAPAGPYVPGTPVPPAPDPSRIARAAALLDGAERPLILAGGGARGCGPAVQAFAAALDAPVVMTTNARGLMGRSPLRVPASPSLGAVRSAMADADAVVALGTEFGPTDYDFHEDHGMPDLARLVRVDIDGRAMARAPRPAVPVVSTAAAALAALSAEVRGTARSGAERAEALRAAALAELPPPRRAMVEMLHLCVEAIPEAVIVGDSTGPVYAGNLYFDTPRDGGYANSATGYGTLGYAPGAAIGAALATGGPVICLIGDGGLQFALSELGTLADEGLPVLVIVWNNAGHGEIADAMRNAGMTPIGVAPTPPDFVAVAHAYGIAAERVGDPAALRAGVGRFARRMRPMLIEVDADAYAPGGDDAGDGH